MTTVWNNQFFKFDRRVSVSIKFLAKTTASNFRWRGRLTSLRLGEENENRPARRREAARQRRRVEFFQIQDYEEALPEISIRLNFHNYLYYSLKKFHWLRQINSSFKYTFHKTKKSFLDKKKEAAFGLTGGPALINL